MMRSGFIALAAAAALGLPLPAVANDKDDRYDHDDRDRHRDRDRHHDRDDRYDDKYGHGKDYDDHDYDYDDYDDDRGDRNDRDYHDHGKACPDSFDLVIAVANDDGDKDRDGIVCCKLIHHGWRKALVCVDQDFDKDDRYHGYD